MYSYIIEFIKRVGENDKMPGCAEHLSGSTQRVQQHRRMNVRFYLSYDTKLAFYL